jgi:hypothetical protein
VKRRFESDCLGVNGAWTLTLNPSPLRGEREDCIAPLAGLFVLSSCAQNLPRIVFKLDSGPAFRFALPDFDSP